MNDLGLKNIIVLKNLPSNIVEEAIIILKENVKTNNVKNGETEVERRIKNGAVIDEAETIINEYLRKQMESSKKNEKIRLMKRYKKLKLISIALVLISIVSVLVSVIT